MASKQLLYYSTNTKLAFRICEDYYGGLHYVWCCPVFNPALEHRLSQYACIPTSSNPHDIYCGLKKDVKGDYHSDKIKANKRGLKRGASFKLKDGVITEEQYADIMHIIDKAILSDFSPYIYLIRADLVENRIIKAPVKKTANPLGVEYQLHDLHTSEFEVLDVLAI